MSGQLDLWWQEHHDKRGTVDHAVLKCGSLGADLADVVRSSKGLRYSVTTWLPTWRLEKTRWLPLDEARKKAEELTREWFADALRAREFPESAGAPAPPVQR